MTLPSISFLKGLTEAENDEAMNDDGVPIRVRAKTVFCQCQNKLSKSRVKIK